MSSCKICGEENCKEHSFFIGKARSIKEFAGSSPPEIFVGRWNYPNVYAGILSPESYGDTEILSSPELWHENKLPISEILKNRNQLIYGRAQSYIKKLDTKFLSVVKEVAMTHKSIATEFKLKKAITKNDENDNKVPLISKAASVESVRLQENTKVLPKVDYIVNDTEVKSSIALLELEKSGISSTNLVKILSAGLLGIGPNRKLVPTRWSITAVDDTLSKNKLEKIRFFQEIKDIEVFSSEYLGNHYEFLLLPEKWSFEVIEIAIKSMGVWQDHETFFQRKRYASDVTGAYYANRLALTEYLERTKRQCTCIVIREIRPEYSVPLGVGILRQISRDAFSKNPKRFNILNEAIEDIQTRLKINVHNFIDRSIIMQNFGKQKKLSSFF